MDKYRVGDRFIVRIDEVLHGKNGYGDVTEKIKCGTCKHFRKFEQTFEREDGAVIYGYCFKDARSDHSPNMGKGYPVWLPPDACGGACKAFKQDN